MIGYNSFYYSRFSASRSDNLFTNYGSMVLVRTWNDTKLAAGLINKSNAKVKILGTGDVEKTLNIKAHAFSKSAREKIEKVGGTVEVI